jgi:HEAT repeat protein
MGVTSMTKRRKPMEATEVVRAAGRESEVLEALEARNRPAVPSSHPLVTELRLKGYPIATVADLYNGRLHYPEAIPILLKWLPRVDDPDIKEGIVRALSVSWAKPMAARPLIQAFRYASDDSWMGLPWAIGNALSVVADDSVYDDLVELIRDKKYGKARQMLAFALANTKNPKAVDVLIDSLQDDDLTLHAVIALGKLKAKKAEEPLRTFLEQPNADLRREARKALEHIARSTKRQRALGSQVRGRP